MAIHFGSTEPINAIGLAALARSGSCTESRMPVNISRIRGRQAPPTTAAKMLLSEDSGL
ncbi:hypothetical protein D3C76_1859190 [compost metagenome]